MGEREYRLEVQGSYVDFSGGGGGVLNKNSNYKM